jgi:SAM-dependent methyltransferase
MKKYFDTQNIKKRLKKTLPVSMIEFLYFIKYYGKKLPSAHVYQRLLRGKSGIEIGGPSVTFKTLVPIYQVIAGLDGVNFASETIWEGSIKEGANFSYYKRKAGNQYIVEAATLSPIESNMYDFVLSSNCLEHIANPLKALKEWIRVTKRNGYLLLVLPNKKDNFDHERPVTSFEHLLEDFDSETNEHDLTHMEEILELHDLSLDPTGGSHKEFEIRCLNNFWTRGMHHHVFDMQLIAKIFAYLELELVQNDTTNQEFFALGKRS